MSIQIFKNHVPHELLFELLNKICVRIKNYYIINDISFKKGQYNNWTVDFINNCRKYYHISKRKYLDKPLNYKSFITIIRQICKFNNIQYQNFIKYEKSSYNIYYYIYIPNNIVNNIDEKIEDTEDKEEKLIINQN